jgi:DNA helicase II / ATP-dependent DNA helicase PcrA
VVQLSALQRLILDTFEYVQAQERVRVTRCVLASRDFWRTASNKILAVTFTRAAARDLRSELLKIKVVGADQIRASTLHSYCLGILSEEYVLEATGRDPRILMEFEESFMLHDLKQPGRMYSANEKLLRAFGASWARFQDELPGRPGNVEDRAFHDELISWLQFHEGMLVGEIAPEALKYLRNNPHADQRSEFEHILVDEYQDLNRANQMLIDVLGENASIAIVGDEDQSIYATLQHAQPEGIRFFPDSHLGTCNFELTECRRCPKRVVALANSVITYNVNRSTAPVTPLASNPDGEVDIVQWRTVEEEAVGIARIVKQYIVDHGVDPGEVLVLSPRRRTSYALRKAINLEGIAVHSHFFEEALDEAEARVQFTLLALTANPDDGVSLRCWLGLARPDREIDQYRVLRDHCHATGIHPAEVLRQIIDGTPVIAGVDRLVRRYQLLVDSRARIESLYGEDLVDALFPRDVEAVQEMRIAALEVVAQVSSAITAGELFDELRIRVQNPEPPPSGGAVRLMSLHSSKGLSAKLVLVTSCIEDWIPSLDTKLSGDAAVRDLEEQRRLFYVALTRSTHKLVLSSFMWIGFADAKLMGIKSFRRQKGGLRVQASRFLDELGPEAPLARAG